MQASARWYAAPALLLLAGWLTGCGGSRDPVQQLSRELSRYPEYSIIVEDLRIDEGFFPDYFLRFRTMTGAGMKVAGRDTLVYKDQVTEWYEVGEEVFSRYENYVGMVVASKDMEGRFTDVRQAYPPAYRYVGNTHYGFWGPGGFWQFYGQYALFRDLMGGWRVGRNDWDDYRRYRERGQPYYGPVSNGRPAFGTRGTVTQTTKPAFYQRYSSRQQAFASKAQSRMGRTSSSWGRGSSRGK